MTTTDAPAMASAELLARLKSYEGKVIGPPQLAPDPVNQPMIRHWVEAIGDENPVYVSRDAARGAGFADVIAPPVSLQAWVMRGVRPRTGPPSLQDEVSQLLNDAGFTSVVATNSTQEYFAPLVVGMELSMTATIESISEEMHTALGVGHFVTMRYDYYDQRRGELVARMLWSILKFRPGSGRQAPPEHDGARQSSPAPRPLRPRPSITYDNAFFFEGAREHRLLIQRCASCHKLRHPPEPRCDACGSYEWDVVEASGRGSVYSYVVNHYPQVPAFDYPLPIGLIELDEGTRLVADLVDVEPSDITVGMLVEVVWQDHDPELSLPAFRPRGGADT